MSSNFLLNSRKYSISVRVLTGQGDGDLIYIDASGHLHHVGPNPAPLRNDKILAAARQLTAAVEALEAAAVPQRSAIGA